MDVHPNPLTPRREDLVVRSFYLYTHRLILWVILAVAPCSQAADAGLIATIDDSSNVYTAKSLGDGRVIDYPWLLRRFVVNMVLRKRPAASAEAYQSIWTDEGSLWG